MSITTSQSEDGKKVTIHVSGRFDFAAHQDFLRAYKEHPRGEKSFIVDLKNTDYMDSSAMGMLLQLRFGWVRRDDTCLGSDAIDVDEVRFVANFPITF